jgi:hypothetical protein
MDEDTVEPQKKRKLSPKEQLLNDCQLVFEHEWTLASGLANGSASVSELKIVREVGADLLFRFIDTRVWQLLMDVITRGLSNGVNHLNTDPRRKPTKMEEVVRFYGIQMAFENSYGNDSHSFRVHYTKVKDDCAKDEIELSPGMDRFQYMLNACVPTTRA